MLTCSNDKRRLNVLVCAGISQNLKERLSSVCSLEFWTGDDRCIPLEYINRADLVIIRSPYWMPENSVENAHSLKAVIRAGSGMDGLCTDDLVRKKIRVHRIQKAGPSVAEHVFALLLSAARSMPKMIAATKTGDWKKADAMGFELYGKTIQVIGFGEVGRSVAQIAAGFCLNILVTDPSVWKPKKKVLLEQLPKIECVELEHGLTLADIVVLCCSLNSGTKNLIDVGALNRMKSGTILVNVARAELIAQDALRSIVKKKHLAAICLDVHFNEPHLDMGLLEDEQIFATPHIGAQTSEARGRIENVVYDLVKGYAMGDGQNG